LAAQRKAIEATIATPVAQPAPPPRPLVSRRLFILGGFWSSLALALIGVLGSPFDFLFPRNVKGFGGPVTVPRSRIPPPGGDPVKIPEGRFWLVNLEPGVTSNGEETAGGLLALWQKCPHLGCTVPWNPVFVFAGRKGWFRCPCHGSTYTREGGVKVAGPAPRSLDAFEIKEVKENGDIVVQTGPKPKFPGSPDNPSKAVPYNV
jgi:cytochrome b6-f complex iron-sulfur subunit